MSGWGVAEAEWKPSDYTEAHRGAYQGIKPQAQLRVGSIGATTDHDKGSVRNWAQDRGQVESHPAEIQGEWHSSTMSTLDGYVGSLVQPLSGPLHTPAIDGMVPSTFDTYAKWIAPYAESQVTDTGFGSEETLLLTREPEKVRDLFSQRGTRLENEPELLVKPKPPVASWNVPGIAGAIAAYALLAR